MNRLNTAIAVVLSVGAIAFVLLLAGFGSEALTDDPPVVNPYASGAGPTTTSSAPGTTLGAPTATTAAPVDEPRLEISGASFGEPLTIAAGSTLTVSNADGISHTWTSRDGLWDSGTLRRTDTFSFTFETAGEYAFFCAIHGSMTGTITVTG